MEHGIFEEGLSYFNQSEARKQCFLTSDWLKLGTLPPELAYSIVFVYRTETLLLRENIYY